MNRKRTIGIYLDQKTPQPSYQVVSFLIFLFIINRIMVRPLQNSMGARDDHIDKIKMDIVDTEKEMKSATFQLEERRSAIRTEAFGIAKDLEESGSKKADEIFASAQEEIAILIEKANKEVDAQIIEVRKHLKEESEALAVNVMDKILDRRLVV